MTLAQAKKLAQQATEITALREMRSYYNAMGRSQIAEEYEEPIRLLMAEHEDTRDESR